MVIKALDPDWIRIRIGIHYGIQPKMLDPDPDEMNAEPQPCLEDAGAHFDGEGAGEKGGHRAGNDLQGSLPHHQPATHTLLVDQVCNRNCLQRQKRPWLDNFLP